MYPMSKAFRQAVLENTGRYYRTGRITTKAGVKVNHTQVKMAAMLNGLEMLSVYTGDDMETYRDVLFYLGQILDGILGMQIPWQSATWTYGERES